MLQNDSVDIAPRMFAATALKGKMINDLPQLPREALPNLRQSLLDVILKYQNGPKPLRTQLCVSLAHLAIQMIEWKDVLPMVISTFLGKGQGATACFLEFLKVLSEEITEGRKINLSVRRIYKLQPVSAHNKIQV
jgi:transportin-3